jgi:aerobic-type carbon monoxide dehydrogenase small subunit (CoxS/CutS family)
MAFSIKINGTDHTVDVDADTPLLWFLRDVLGMTGTKFCGVGLCGACTVHVAGAATRARKRLAASANPERQRLRPRSPTRSLRRLVSVCESSQWTRLS